MSTITPHGVAANWPLMPPVRMEPVAQGTNNRSFIVTSHEGRFFLKTYRNQLAGERMAFEHALLCALDASSLPFAAPVPIATQSGATVVEIASGRERWLASLSPLIPGRFAPFGDASETRQCGEALAILTEALAMIELPSAVSVPPTYGDFATVHPLVTDPEEAIRHDLEAAALVDELASLLAETAREWTHRTAGWTEQIIHADFYPANVMVHGGRVSGVLDFEFAGSGYRAMDFVTGLMAFGLKRQPDDGWDLAEAFARGYLRRLPLDTSEIEAVPMLLRMRELTSLLHWLGRLRQGLTTRADIEERGRRALGLHRWLDEHQRELVQRLISIHRLTERDHGTG